MRLAAWLISVKSYIYLKFIQRNFNDLDQSFIVKNEYKNFSGNSSNFI